MKPSNNKYNITTITIHWLSTVLILILFPMGSYMSGLDTTEKLGLVQTHALLGISVFLLTIIRTYFFFTKKRPKDIQTGSPINNKLII
jgi:cytochrome b561